MVFFTDVKKTEHYSKFHEKDVSWDTVVSIIFSVKNPRKKGAKYEIEQNGFYILFEIKNNTLYVINAKTIK